MSTAWERLQQVMLELHIEAKKSLGQNFLISDHVIEKIIRATLALKPAHLIEVGPGLGALTFFLKDSGVPLQLLELDQKLVLYWQKQGLNVAEGDALQMDWQPFISDEQTVLVSNLPYQISSSLVIDRCLDEKPLAGMVLMFQKEVAQRLKAQKGHELYGMLSVVAQSFWDLELLLEASSRDFHPAPKVASRVLIFKSKKSPVEDKKKYLRFVKSAFLHPRKLMVSNLEEGLGVPKDQLQSLATELGFNEKIRAAELKVSDFLDFYRKLGYR